MKRAFGRVIRRTRAIAASQITQRSRMMRFRREFAEFRRLTRQLATSQRFSVNWNEREPHLADRTASTGFDAHYVYHTAWAARAIARRRPAAHVDISSYLYLSTLLSAFVPIEFYDYRPASVRLSGLTCRHADLMQLPFASMSVESLSCLHVLEHVGLGRYGDPLDPDGDLKAMRELSRVLSCEGMLLIAVPVGRPRVVFNAHRIYSYEQVVDGFSELRLVEAALIPDDSSEGIVGSPSPTLMNAQQYGCGCFLFTRSEGATTTA